MAELLTHDMKVLIAELGELVKADPRNETIRQAIEDYERSDELNALIGEYNAQQNALTDLYTAAGDGTTLPYRLCLPAQKDKVILFPFYGVVCMGFDRKM